MTCVKKGDYEKALQCLTEAMEKGFPEAQRYYAYLLDMDPGFRRAVEQQYNQQTSRFRSPSEIAAAIKAAADKLKEAAEQGDAESQFKLGQCHQNGRGVKQDDAKAAQWYRKAAEQRHAGAQFKLGQCYQNGEGVKQDDAEAAKWYRKAAKQGQPDAEFNLGECYYAGHGVVQNYSQAANWYRKAAEQGHVGGQFKLAECLFTGSGKTRNEEDAVQWYRKAAEKGHAGAQFKLAECCLKGSGVTRDEANAVKWYHKAAEQGHTEAKFILAECLSTGWGVEANKQDAVKWYRKAAEDGHPQAQFKLGSCYSNGTGVKEDRAEAAKWYRRAAEQGVATTWTHFVLGEACFSKKDFAEAVKRYDQAVAEQGNAKSGLSLSDRKQIADHLLEIISASSSTTTIVDSALKVLTRLSCWDSFSGKDWKNLLSVRPNYAKFCGLTADSTVTYWTKMSVDDWQSLANKEPLFKPYYDLRRGNNVARHLSEHPGMEKFCKWNVISEKGWVNLLKKDNLISSLLHQQPDLLRFCHWDDFSGKNWADLLSVCPKYAKYIKWDNLLKKDDFDFESLKTISDQLMVSTIFATNCPPLSIVEKLNWGKYKDWSGTTAKEWLDILIDYPGLADFCKCWNGFSTDNWARLLSKQPQFESRCHCWDKFEAKHWNQLPSSMYGHFPYDLSKVWNYTDYDGGIGKHLSKKFAFRVASGFAFVFTFISLFGETGWFSLLAESKVHALISGTVWIVASVLCVLGYTNGWGPFFRNRWLNVAYAGLTSFSLYTFYHWSFLFSRWSWGLIFLALISLLMFAICAKDASGSKNDFHSLFLAFLPWFVIYSWFMLSPVKCSGWLIVANAVLFLITILLGFVAFAESDKKIVSFSCVVSVILPLAIGIWFLLSPVDSDACYKMADSLKPSFQHASTALIRKGQSADPDFAQLENQLVPENDFIIDFPAD